MPRFQDILYPAGRLSYLILSLILFQAPEHGGVQPSGVKHKVASRKTTKRDGSLPHSAAKAPMRIFRIGLYSYLRYSCAGEGEQQQRQTIDCPRDRRRTAGTECDFGLVDSPRSISDDCMLMTPSNAHLSRSSICTSWRPRPKLRV